MERGLLWLPLLGLFIWLAWAGWHEYRKLEAYKTWASEFERAKYDIYAALGQQGEQLVWGAPTRQGPVNLQTVSLPSVETIALYGDTQPLPPNAVVPRGCQIALALSLKSGAQHWIPFTDLDLATAWKNQLQTLLDSLQSTPQP